MLFLLDIKFGPDIRKATDPHVILFFNGVTKMRASLFPVFLDAYALFF